MGEIMISLIFNFFETAFPFFEFVLIFCEFEMEIIEVLIVVMLFWVETDKAGLAGECGSSFDGF
jgi:hypothetical protein